MNPIAGAALVFAMSALNNSRRAINYVVGGGRGDATAMTYREADMQQLSAMRPKKCVNCGQSRDTKGVPFFVGTDGITCTRCQYNYRPNLTNPPCYPKAKA